jgi:hypothetical protein
MILEITSCVFGFLLTPLLNSIGILAGKEGVIYYGEVHQSLMNKIIHFVFMIPTTFATIMIIPCVFDMSGKDYNKVLKSLYIIYITHYMTIDVISGINVSIMYYFPFILACNTYVQQDRHFCLNIGINLLLVSLFIQEIFGHFLFEQRQSRFEGIFNAILYAPFYSVYGLLI